MNDLKYALRMLLKSPGFSLIAIATLALGIGANSAIFTVVNGILLQPLPYAQPEALVSLKSNQSVPELADIQTQSRSFESIGGVALQAADYAGGAEPVQLDLGLVTGEFFRVFQTPTALGRTITAEDDQFGGARVLVLSHALWQSQFGSDANVLGRSITVAGQSYTIIGVTASGFQSPRGRLDAYVPVHVFYPLAAKSRGAHLLRVYGRLAAGIKVAAAQSELRVVDERL